MAEPTRGRVTLSYGPLALLLLAALAIGLVSGGALVGVAMSAVDARTASSGEQSAQPGRAWLGITYVPITQGVAKAQSLPVTQGALIVAVTRNGPSAKAGLRERDIITRIDERTLDENTSLLDIVKEKKPGERMQVTFLRDAVESTVAVTAGRSPVTPIAPNDRNLFDRLRRGLLRIMGR